MVFILIRMHVFCSRQNQTKFCKKLKNNLQKQGYLPIDWCIYRNNWQFQKHRFQALKEGTSRKSDSLSDAILHLISTSFHSAVTGKPKRRALAIPRFSEPPTIHHSLSTRPKGRFLPSSLNLAFYSTSTCAAMRHSQSSNGTPTSMILSAGMLKKRAASWALSASLTKRCLRQRDIPRLSVTMSF